MRVSATIIPAWKQSFLQYPESMEGLFCCTRQENHKYFSGDCPCAGFPVKENREWYPAAHRFLQMLSGLESVFRFQSKKYDCWKHFTFSASSAWLIFNSFLRLFMRVPMAFRFICIEFPANLYFIKYLSNALAYQKTGKLKQNVKEKFCNTWNIYNIRGRKVL